MNDRVFKVFDYHNNNKISKEEFLFGMAYFCKADRDEIFMNIFKLFDLRSDNTVAYEELLSILKVFPKITHNLRIKIEGLLPKDEFGLS